MIDPAATASAIASVLGGTFFRLALGSALDRLKDWQEYRFEIGRMRIQNALENSQSDRHVRMLEAQKKLGLQQVYVEREKEEIAIENEQFNNALADIKKPTGFKFLDVLNSAIRPVLAIICILVWLAYLEHRGWALGSWDLELIGTTLGLFIGSRISKTGA